MAFSINDMRSQLVGGGWRPNHFQVIITYPFAAQADQKSPFMVKAASIPSVTIGKAEASYFGRRIGLPGDRVVEDWVVTVMNDTDFLVRDALERWSNIMNSFQGNIALAGNNPNDYKSQAILQCFDRSKNVIREYEMHGIFPLSVGSMDTAWDTTDIISEFQVVFSMDDFTLLDGLTGPSIGTEGAGGIIVT